MINPIKAVVITAFVGVTVFVALSITPAQAFSYDSDAEKASAYQAAAEYCKEVNGESKRDKCIGDVMLYGYSDLVIGKHTTK